MIEMKSVFSALVNEHTEQNKKMMHYNKTNLDECRSQNTIIKTQNSEIRI